MSSPQDRVLAYLEDSITPNKKPADFWTLSTGWTTRYRIRVVFSLSFLKKSPQLFGENNVEVGNSWLTVGGED
jgi:hypothetical protein